jgi:hypothetical protein
MKIFFYVSIVIFFSFILVTTITEKHNYKKLDGYKICAV